MFKIRRIVFSACVVAGLGMAAAPAAMAQTAPKTMLVAVGLAFPPFHMQVDGKLKGFDIDMINAIAKAEGWKAEIKSIPFNGLIPSLQAGAIDVAVSSITITKSRMKTVNFSDAYYRSGISVVVRKDSPITGFKDIGDKIIGVQKGTSSIQYALSHGIKRSQIRRYNLLPTAFFALTSGSVDAVLADNPANLKYVTTHDDAKIVGDLLTGEYFGMAIRKSRPELVKVINAGLAKIKASGVYDQLFAKWMGGNVHGKVEGVLAPEKVAK